MNPSHPFHARRLALARPARSVLFALLALAIAGCGGGGGGGGGGSGGGNDDPSFTSDTTVKVPENETATGYTAAADDPDGDTLTFSLSGGPDAAAFAIDPASGEFVFTTAPDFENPADSDGDNDYVVEIEADDGNGGTTTRTVTVSVTDVISQFEMSVSYPTPNANLGGRVDQTTVAGTLTETENGVVEVVEPGDVDHIDVNGTMAHPDKDDPARWSVQVPVETPGDTLDVTVGFMDGTTDTTSQSLDNQPLFEKLGAIALDTANDRALVVDTALDALFAVDLTSGERTVISDADPGTSFSAQVPGVALDADNDRALVIDEKLDALMAVDLGSGDRTIVSDNDNDGDDFVAPADVVLDATNNRALVVDYGLNALVAVDLKKTGPTYGDRTIVSDEDNGTGTDFEVPVAVALDANNNRALVTDHLFGGTGLSGVGGAVVAVDLTNGDRTSLSDKNDKGHNFMQPTGITLDAANNRALVVDPGVQALVAVNLTTRERTIVSNHGTGTGASLHSPYDVVLDAANDRALVVDASRGSLQAVAVDLKTGPTNGDRTPLSNIDVGNGPELHAPESVTLDVADDRALMIDHDALLAADLANGDRTVVSDDSNDRPNFDQPRDATLDAANDRVLVVDERIPAVVAVDRTSGERTILSDHDGTGGTGTGPGLSSPKDVTLDAANGRALMVDDGLPALVAVDLASGNRTILSDDGCTGGGDGLADPETVTLDAENNRVLVIDFQYTDSDFITLVAVDLDTGDRTVVSNKSTGTGPNFVSPSDVVLDAANDRALVIDTGLEALVAVDLANGDRTIVSDEDTGTGIPFSGPLSLTLDAANGRILVGDGNGLFVVEPDSGERALASSHH